MALYDKLVKLGETRDDLRPHIRPVLSHLKDRSRTARSNHEFGGTLYRNHRERMVAILEEWVTAGGLNSNQEALDFLADGPRSNIREMKQNWDLDPEDLADLADNWREYAGEVQDMLSRSASTRKQAASFGKVELPKRWSRALDRAFSRTDLKVDEFGMEPSGGGGVQLFIAAKYDGPDHEGEFKGQAETVISMLEKEMPTARVAGGSFKHGEIDFEIPLS